MTNRCLVWKDLPPRWFDQEVAEGLKWDGVSPTLYPHEELCGYYLLRTPPLNRDVRYEDVARAEWRGGPVGPPFGGSFVALNSIIVVAEGFEGAAAYIRAYRVCDLEVAQQFPPLPKE